MTSTPAAARAAASDSRRLKLLSANIQAGASTRRYTDYATRSWSHVLPAGNKRASLDAIAELAALHDIVGLQESDPGSWRSGFTNQTHYLAERAGFDFWSHQPNRSVGVVGNGAAGRRVGVVASSANALLSRIEPVEVSDHPLPGRIAGRGVLVARFGRDRDSLTIAVAHLSLGAGSRRSQLAFIGELLQGPSAQRADGRFQLHRRPAGDGAAVPAHAPAAAGLRRAHLPQLASAARDRPRAAVRGAALRRHARGAGGVVGPPGAVGRAGRTRACTARARPARDPRGDAFGRRLI